MRPVIDADEVWDIPIGAPLTARSLDDLASRLRCGPDNIAPWTAEDKQRLIEAIEKIRELGAVENESI